MDQPSLQIRFVNHRFFIAVFLLLIVSMSGIGQSSHIAYADDSVDAPTANCDAQGLGFHTADANLELTAGHCISSENSYWWQYSGGIDAALQVTSDPLSNHFFLTPDGPSYADLTEIANGSDITNGAVACSTGSTSGYRCGTIIRTDYAPSYVANATPSFLVIDAQCQAGDSGTVWYFQYHYAMGITSGRINATGQCIITPLPSILDATGLGDSLQLNTD